MYSILYIPEGLLVEKYYNGHRLFSRDVYIYKFSNEAQKEIFTSVAEILSSDWIPRTDVPVYYISRGIVKCNHKIQAKHILEKILNRYSSVTSRPMFEIINI